ncbi:MAG: lasso peptide biosynthesis B2 protein [Solirubrobacteraceae bacterium]
MAQTALTRQQAIAMNAFSVDLATVRVMGRLHAAGIRCILLKGGALRSSLYGPNETRPYADIDVLVAPEQIDAAAAVMKAQGWTDSYYQSPIGHAHHMEAPPGGFPFPLDLHRSFHYVTVAPRQVWELLSARAASIQLAGRDIETLDHAGLALIVALHLVGHGERAKLVDDLERALARFTLDVWREAAQLAGRLGASDAFAAALRHVGDGRRVADALGLERSTDPTLHLALGAAPRTARLVLDLREAGARPAALLAVLVPELFPPAIHMHEHYPLARRGRVGLLCAYAVRPFQLMPELVTGWQAATTAQRGARALSGSPPARGRRGLGRLGRVGLAGEIVVTYLRITRKVRRTTVSAVLRDVRDASLERAAPACAAEADAARLARGTVRVLRRLPGDTRCLSRSLVLSALLARRGVASRVVIAVRGAGADDFGAHAWVEIDGQVLLAPGAPGDARLVEL